MFIFINAILTGLASVYVYQSWLKYKVNYSMDKIISVNLIRENYVLMSRESYLSLVKNKADNTYTTPL